MFKNYGSTYLRGDKVTEETVNFHAIKSESN